MAPIYIGMCEVSQCRDILHYLAGYLNCVGRVGLWKLIRIQQ